MTDERVPVLELEPELGELIPPAERTAASAAALVRVLDLPAGPWDEEPTRDPAGGFLIVQGCLSREMHVLGQVTAVDFLARGDVLHTGIEPTITSVPVHNASMVLEPTRLALLDARFLSDIQPWPQLTASLLRRQERRCAWLAHVLAVGHLPRVELRVLVLFWMFADRWGHKTANGVQVPIPLTHVNIARLIGAQRPTVTSALRQLIATGQVAQAGKGHWTLHGDPPDISRR